MMITRTQGKKINLILFISSSIPSAFDMIRNHIMPFSHERKCKNWWSDMEWNPCRSFNWFSMIRMVCSQDFFLFDNDNDKMTVTSVSKIDFDVIISIWLGLLLFIETIDRGERKKNNFFIVVCLTVSNQESIINIRSIYRRQEKKKPIISSVDGITLSLTLCKITHNTFTKSRTHILIKSVITEFFLLRKISLIIDEQCTSENYPYLLDQLTEVGEFIQPLWRHSKEPFSYPH